MNALQRGIATRCGSADEQPPVTWLTDPPRPDELRRAGEPRQLRGPGLVEKQLVARRQAEHDPKGERLGVRQAPGQEDGDMQERLGTSRCRGIDERPPGVFDARPRTAQRAMCQRNLEQRERAGRDPCQQGLPGCLQRWAHLIGQGETGVTCELRLERQSQELPIQVGHVTTYGRRQEAVPEDSTG